MEDDEEKVTTLPLLQMRSFTLLYSDKMDGNVKVRVPGPGNDIIHREPFLVLAAAQFHRSVCDSEGSDVGAPWIHEIAEMSFGKPSLKRYTIHVTEIGRFKLFRRPAWLGPRARRC